MSRRVKNINTGIVSQRSAVSPTPGMAGARGQQLGMSNFASQQISGSFTARNGGPSQKRAGILLQDQNQPQQPGQGQGPRTIRSTKSGFRNQPAGNSQSQTRAGQNANQPQNGNNAWGTPEIRTGRANNRLAEAAVAKKTTARGNSTQSRSADEQSRKRAATSNKVTTTTQGQINKLTYGEYKNSSMSTFSNKSTSAGGLWPNNSSLNTKNFMEKKLMRDPDQIGSQMMNKAGTNTSSLIFGNRSPLNNSAAVHGNISTSGSTTRPHLQVAGTKLTQSNQLNGILNFSPIKQTNSDFDEQQLYLNTNQQFGPPNSSNGGHAYGAAQSLGPHVQSQRGFTQSSTLSGGSTFENNPQSLAQQTVSMNPSIFNVVGDPSRQPRNGTSMQHGQGNSTPGVMLLSEPTAGTLGSAREQQPQPQQNQNQTSITTRSKNSNERAQDRPTSNQTPQQQYQSPNFYNKPRPASSAKSKVKTNESKQGGKKQGGGKKKQTNHLLLQASMGTQVARSYNTNSSLHPLQVTVPVAAQFQAAISNAIKLGASAMQIIKLVEKKELRARQRRFEAWKFTYLGHREGFQVITQTKHLQMQYSSSDDHRDQRSQKRVMHMDHHHLSSDSKSFYTDISVSIDGLSKATPSKAILTTRQVVLTKCIAAAFRFRSRRVASFFWRWKYVQPALMGGGRSTIHGGTQQTNVLDADSEVADLMKKYKLLDQSQEYDLDDEDGLSNQNGSRAGEGLPTDENIDDEDEAVISKQKKKEFEQPVQYAGPDKHQYDFNPNEHAVVNQTAHNNPTKKPDDGSPKPKIFYQILNSRNKDFGRILRTQHSAASSVASYEEIGGDGEEAGTISAANVGKISANAYSKSKALMMVEKYLSKRIRCVLRLWRLKTDTYLNDVKFKLRVACNEVQKGRVKRICALMVSNERAMSRHLFHSFMHWRLETEVEKRALDRRQQLFMITNAKLDVQRSKTALQSLYRQKRAQQKSGMSPTAGSMFMLHPVSHTAGVQTSFDEDNEEDEVPAPPTKSQVQHQIKDRVKNICYDMIQQIARDLNSKQGASTLDHGEANSSHLSGASTTDLQQINAQAALTPSHHSSAFSNNSKKKASTVSHHSKHLP